MIVYSPAISPRLQYICEFIGQELTGESFRLTDDSTLFIKAEGAKINYSSVSLAPNEFHIKPNGLLFQSDIRKQLVEVIKEEGYPVFFNTGGDMVFDIFSAVFYLVSRYEEYLPHEKDMYGRYAHTESVACKNGFLDQPVVNQWLIWLGQKLSEKFPGFPVKQTSFQFIPTYDIDEAWSYKHKSILRKIGGGVKALLKGNKEEYALRKKVEKGELADPYDAYEWMDTLHREYGLKPCYFFLVAEKNGRYDRNILPGEPALKELIQRHAAIYPVGIHPSWQTGDDDTLLRKEIGTLLDITHKKIDSSRQHFIRFNLPETFRRLIEAGIRHDYSMGYGSINGFRASVCSPVYWYDLEKEAQTPLLLHPFCYMDANSFFEQQFTPLQALEEMHHYYKMVKEVRGQMITIWHNTFLGTAERFTGWKEAYRDFIKEVTI